MDQNKPMNLRQLRRHLARVKSYKRHSPPGFWPHWEASVKYWQGEIAHELRRRAL